MALCLLAAVAAPSNASFVSELLFLGEGTYDHDANPKDPMGYGSFGSTVADFDIILRTPEEACHWYLNTDVTLSWTEQNGALGATHVVRMDQAGIWADEHLVEWTDLGYDWTSQLGIHLGYHDPGALDSYDPLNIIGDHSWDIDGGGDDLLATVSPSSTPRYRYHLAAEQMRSMSWLGSMPLGELATEWMGTFTGGLPLDGLELGFNKIAPFLSEWDGRSYDVSYRGRVLLTADSASPVPEPSTLLLLAAGLVTVGSLGRRGRRR